MTQKDVMEIDRKIKISWGETFPTPPLSLGSWAEFGVDYEGEVISYCSQLQNRVPHGLISNVNTSDKCRPWGTLLSPERIERLKDAQAFLWSWNIAFGYSPRLICNDPIHFLIFSTSQRAFWECWEYPNSSFEKYSGLKLKAHQPEVFNKPNLQAR